MSFTLADLLSNESTALVGRDFPIEEASDLVDSGTDTIDSGSLVKPEDYRVAIVYPSLDLSTDGARMGSSSFRDFYDSSHVDGNPEYIVIGVDGKNAPGQFWPGRDHASPLEDDVKELRERFPSAYIAVCVVREKRPSRRSNGTGLISQRDHYDTRNERRNYPKGPIDSWTVVDDPTEIGERFFQFYFRSIFDYSEPTVIDCVEGNANQRALLQ